MSTFLIQKEYANSPESRAVLQAALFDDGRIVRAALEDLEDPGALDIDVSAIPVGSVEFVREYAARFCVPMPPDIDYPDDLRPFLERNVRKMYLRDAPAGAFVKPACTKQFDAIRCYDPADPPLDSGDTLCWVSDPVEFRAEYRFYVLRRALLGWAQYDDGPECGIGRRDMSRIGSMILAWREQPGAWALDAGRLPDGRLALIEVNDAWATGYYPGAMRPRDYARWLSARWREIVRQGMR